MPETTTTLYIEDDWMNFWSVVWWCGSIKHLRAYA